MYIYETSLRVRYAETDQMGIVYYGNYAQYFEVGRVEAIRNLGVSYKQIEEMGILMPVVQMQVKYLRSAAYDDEITIRTSVEELKLAHNILFKQEVFNQKQKLLTSGHIELFFIDKQTKKKVNMPAELYQALSKYFS